MPSYTTRDRNTGATDTFVGSWTEFRSHLDSNQDLEQIIVKATVIDGVRVGQGRHKPSDGFRDLLRNAKRRNPRSTIDTY